MKTSWRLLEDVFHLRFWKTSLRHLCQDQDKYICFSHTSSEDVFKTSWSRPICLSWSYVFRTSSRCFQDIFKTSCHDIFKMSSRRLAKTSLTYLQHVLQRSLQDVFKTYHQVQLFVLVNTYSRSLRDVFNTFVRCTAKTVIYRGICLSHTSEKFMVSAQNLHEW